MRSIEFKIDILWVPLHICISFTNNSSQLSQTLTSSTILKLNYKWLTSRLYMRRWLDIKPVVNKYCYNYWLSSGDSDQVRGKLRNCIQYQWFLVNQWYSSHGTLCFHSFNNMRWKNIHPPWSRFHELFETISTHFPRFFNHFSSTQNPIILSEVWHVVDSCVSETIM